MTRRLLLILTFALLGTASQMIAQPQQVPKDKPPGPTWRKLVGFDTAYQRLRLDMPLGRNIVVGYVESSIQGGYLPNAAIKPLAGVRFVPRSGLSKKPSSHATHGAKIAFGAKGIAPGVKEVHGYQVAHWLSAGYLNTGTADPPHDDGLKLFNHSWISGSTNPAQTAEVLRRVDYQVDAHDVVMCVGVNNGYTSPVPPLLASAYNVIAVGTARNGGDSSGGYTRVEGVGRCKPDIVGPRDLTSFATPSVTASVAVLMERAYAMPDKRARQAEVIKAALLGGAVKSNAWANTPKKPLDEHFGAGIVNIDRSLAILDGGPMDSDSNDFNRAFGWDLLQLRADEQQVYHFETVQLWREASFVIVWHRRIDGRTVTRFGTDQKMWLDIPRMANIDLKLIRYNEQGKRTVLAQSTSSRDNVELIYRRVLPAGRYRIEVMRHEDAFDEPWDIAMAWWMRPAPPEVSSKNSPEVSGSVENEPRP